MRDETSCDLGDHDSQGVRSGRDNRAGSDRENEKGAGDYEALRQNPH